ncbi:hypothetical protein PTTG_04152 [Puccinia triticina 1-1 BBBD Race 1]|uniref:Uncharacterized protein n=1 Tax=Puccinia triticina (isolate 1-1 / race 1 (BBBD)) TaxID=630390 RepID=A0A0C4ETM3_PUCT1|nr:hypothetical protein PTTG_04152 [Puccinia triticina 1-1 BBBD Race 1]
MSQIYAKHPPNTKYLSKWPVYIDPTDPSRIYIPLTTLNTQLWAHDILKEVKGVDYFTPPSALRFKKLSAHKKRKLSHHVVEEATPPPRKSSPAKALENSLVAEPDKNLMAQYLEFVKIQESKRDEVLRILKEEDVIHPRFFELDSITPADMKSWGFTAGIITQLQDNVKKFEKSRTPQ